MMAPSTSGTSRTTSIVESFSTKYYILSNISDADDHYLIPARTAFSSDLKPQSLLPTLLSSQINTLFLSSSNQSDVLTSFYREFDIEFAKKNTGLLSYSSSTASPSGIRVDLKKGLGRDVPDVIVPRSVRDGGKPFVFKGITHNPGHLNPYLIPILHAPSGTYSDTLPSTSSPSNSNSDADNDDDEEEEEEISSSRKGGKKSGKKDKWSKVISGKEAGLISVFQSRGNVRFGWVGGVDVVKDDVWNEK